MNFTFPTYEKYLEAWMYLVRMGVGFSYDQGGNSVDIERSDDLEDDLDTIARLKDIQTCP